jgi:uncharacterized membrane protein
VFAITVTLLVLEIRPPTDYTNLLHGLVALWPSYLAYALTFLFIGQVWANHQVIFDHIRAADRVILLLNTLLLMIVAFLPFTTSVLAGALRSGHGLRTATVFYGIAFDSTALTFKAVWQYARRHRLLSEALDPADATAIGRRFQLALAWLTTGVPRGLLIPFWAWWCSLHSTSFTGSRSGVRALAHDPEAISGPSHSAGHGRTARRASQRTPT